MRTIACIVSPIALVAVIACNTPSSGENDRLEFTPTECGNPLLGCDLGSGVVVGGSLEVEVRGVGAVTTDGVTLVSATPTVLAVVDIADVGVPTWELRAVAAGTATLSAVDAGGVEVDTLTFTVAAPERLAMVKLAGNATGPTDEAGVDEAWQVDAGGLVSFQAAPMRGSARLIGRLDYTLTVPPGSTLLETEQSNSDPTIGYLYVQPAAGDYTFTFSAGNPALSVDVALHAR